MSGIATDDDGLAQEESERGVWCSKHKRVFHGDECELCVIGAPAYTAHGQPMPVKDAPTKEVKA